MQPSHVKPISIITLFFLLIFVSACFCEDDVYYAECKRTFNCGNLQNLSYPFWSDERSKICGEQGFKLKCEAGEFPNITISNQEFRVISVDQAQFVITIARADSWGSVCLQNFTDTVILNEGFFMYSQSVVNMNLFYDCPVQILDLLPSENLLPCSSENDQSLIDFYASDELLREWGIDERTCEDAVKITVPWDDWEQMSSGADGLMRLMKQGFNVSYRFHGKCRLCHASHGICATNRTTSTFTCLCPDQSHESWCPYDDDGNMKGFLYMKIGGGIVFGIIGILIGSCIVICYFKKKSSWKISKGGKNLEAFLKSHRHLPVKRYSFLQIKKITNHFKDKLGKGGYGSVYKGKLFDGRFVAVKILNASKGEGDDFINEVESISRTSHVNVVTLLGFCLEGEKRVLIYEFLPNGSLDKFICSETCPNNLPDGHLEWKIMHQIAIGIGRGLDYLHRGCNTRIVHFDIKPHNILLDEHFCPKISDFGLAKLCSRQESIVSMSEARGTIGYIAPEVFSRNFGKVSYKSDVYSYGMMILEMIGGKRKDENEADHTTSEYFPDWIYRRLELDNDTSELYEAISMEENEMVRKMTVVGLWCIQTNPSERPSMSRVIEMLQGSIQALQIPPKPFPSSPPRPLTACSLAISI